MAITVIQERILSGKVLTLSPMIWRLLVINRMKSNKGGVENPCTMPEYTNARMGLKPRKFRPTAIIVKATITA